MARLAYVDHRSKFIPKEFLGSLQNAGIEFKLYHSFDEFYKENNLKDFPALLCHPGLDSQKELEKIAKQFPHLKMAIISFTEWEYCESDIPAFSYNIPGSVVKWVIENQ